MQVDETLVLGNESLEVERLEISQYHLTLFLSQHYGYQSTVPGLQLPLQPGTQPLHSYPR
jgi:hypothetical protein